MKRVYHVEQSRHYYAKLRRVIGRTTSGRIIYGPLRTIGLPPRLNGFNLPGLGRFTIGAQVYTISQVYSLVEAK